MSTPKRCSLLLAAALVLAGLVCAGDDDDAADGATAAEPAPATSVPVPVVATTDTPATPVPADDPRLPEGVYRTPELTRDQLIATGVAAGFAEADVAAGLDRDGVTRGVVVGVRLAAGGWSLLFEVDGGPEEVGWRGTYDVVDDDTVIATDASCGSIAYRYALDGDQLTLELVDDQCGGGVGELIAQTISYQTSPFTKEPAAAGSDATGATSAYASKAFVLPFDVTVPAWLPGEAAVDEPNFVTWEAADIDRAVRFLVPVELYPPGGTGTSAPPDDYLEYLLGQSADGAEFTDVTETTVDGRPATIVTANVADHLDGSLGCPETGMTAADCFGLQPDLTLRIAVIDAGDQTLLVWVRDIRGAPAEYESFEAMVASIRFDDERAPSTVATTVPVATPIDGTWSTSFSEAELSTSPLLYGPEEVNVDNWGQFTLTLEAGRFELVHGGGPDAVTGTFGVDGDVLTLDLDNHTERFVMHWRLDADTLTLVRDDAIGVGPTPLVIRPWTRQP